MDDLELHAHVPRVPGNLDETARIPLGRRGKPEDIAAWIVHLADPASTWLTGQILTVDGGLELT